MIGNDAPATTLNRLYRGPHRPSCLFWSRRILVAALFLPALTGFAPQRPVPADSATAVVVARALESPELPAMASGLLDTIGGRLSGTPAGTRAEAWAAGWMRGLGLDTVYYEVVRIPVWRRGTTHLQVVTPATARHRPIAAAALGYAPAIVADSVLVVDVGRGDSARVAALGDRVKGAAWLTDVINPDVLARAVRAGAAALLRITLEPGRLPQARVAPWPDVPAPLPALSVSREDGLWLRRLTAAGPVVMTLRVEAETRPGTVLNVVGEWEGSDPSVADQVFLLGAHLDAWDLGDGAIDNGTGVLSVMAAAGALAGSGLRPRRTVRVVLFAAEELGLRGSREYVKTHAGAMGDVVAMMNLDMVGDPEGYGATGHPEADTLFARLARDTPLRDLALHAEVNHGGGPGSDHQPFLLAGVPTIYVQTSLPPDAPRWYHNAGDTFDKIDLDAVRATAAAAAAAAWALADHPGRPLRTLSPEETAQLIQRLGW
ncbi:MAG: M20/M25/M40 family metallo-hydrolase [Gemmatimonadetes bacterium]|uniref:Carboxypeptidase Q n=1 Tax=Candidatus Kutchimonas denitrificans TaxID=3056748 RepID=A0AAE5CBY8_9BACT|nr:M20/M25/M40 family metallo-hydrolase [Gemmatimonadota bacterium]NIR76457.1 M20/M25/M40 family metallo-hydrolase [Candidatus Kutchimonas denitrificans]NIS03275.1 M20/M25/M40 family metallo-hydrolase [Gemmatimonadota bacterium]NIT69136.1 M20/M25/M40 family metallo-hydrolase [Gemmatimonadota bacterium]NIU54528.1 M20/M25/M40 family metallo-hydrolase [Gemmatimonadota bacterium]